MKDLILKPIFDLFKNEKVDILAEIFSQMICKVMQTFFVEKLAKDEPSNTKFNWEKKAFMPVANKLASSIENSILDYKTGLFFLTLKVAPEENVKHLLFVVYHPQSGFM